MLRRCLLALLAVLGCAASAGAGCPSADWSPRGGHCYYSSSVERSWLDAGAFCRGHGGHLVSIGDPLENTFVAETLGGKVGPRVHFWIGFNDRLQEGHYRWSDGAAVSYVNWKDGQPNGGDAEDCVYMYSTLDASANQQWFDFDCSHTMYFMCKVSSS